MPDNSKKYFLTVALSLAIVGGSFSATPVMAQDEGPATEIVAGQSGQQTDVIVDPTPSEEVDYVQESPVARKMTQAEKAHNAAVNDSWGGAITIIAMCIVIAALVVLSLLFLGFGKISQTLMTRKKRAVRNISADAPEEHHEVDSGDVIAAIAAALAEHFGEGHDMEDTILTIRKLQKAYSPWSSKIYNLRNMPDHRRNTPGQASL